VVGVDVDCYPHYVIDLMEVVASHLVQSTVIGEVVLISATLPHQGQYNGTRRLAARSSYCSGEVVLRSSGGGSGAEAMLLLVPEDRLEPTLLDIVDVLDVLIRSVISIDIDDYWLTFLTWPADSTNTLAVILW
jgi:hypothetical protein